MLNGVHPLAIFEERLGPVQLDQINQALKDEALKQTASEATQSDYSKAQRPDRLSKIINSLKLYRVIPDAKSPEKSELLAAGLHAKVAEAEPVPDKDLMGLAAERAKANLSELQGPLGIPANVGSARETPGLHPMIGGLSAGLLLDAIYGSCAFGEGPRFYPTRMYA